MTAILLIGYVAVIVVSYKGAIWALQKANLL